MKLRKRAEGVMRQILADDVLVRGDPQLLVTVAIAVIAGV
jgi:ABC-type bacteriocin/lantibiotic exporter with double-glycine peptidase domain